MNELNTEVCSTNFLERKILKRFPMLIKWRAELFLKDTPKGGLLDPQSLEFLEYAFLKAWSLGAQTIPMVIFSNSKR